MANQLLPCRAFSERTISKDISEFLGGRGGITTVPELCTLKSSPCNLSVCYLCVYQGTTPNRYCLGHAWDYWMETK